MMAIYKENIKKMEQNKYTINSTLQWNSLLTGNWQLELVLLPSSIIHKDGKWWILF